VGVVEAVGALAGVAGVLAGGAGGEGGEGGLTGRAGKEGGLTAGGEGALGTASGLTGMGGLTGAAGAAGAAGGVGALAGGAGALGAAAKGTATTKGFAPVGADDAEEVELLGNALPLTAAAAIGVAEEEGIEELLEELFEVAAPEKIDWIEGGKLSRALERRSRSDFSLSKSS
jgi:hypothetical protein